MNPPDRHRLYELSVQCAEAEIDFVDATFETLRGRRARLLREDFCGTAAVCREWISRRPDNRALGVDLHPEVLEWGRRRNLSPLTPDQRRRVRLIEGDVLATETEPPDVILAMNFSYWLLRDRKRLLAYFCRTHERLADDGVFFLDAYGGYDAFRTIEEERQIEADDLRFTYVWEQADYDPVSGRLVCHIHFRFPDGTAMERAFSYEWRLWTLPEIRELLDEAGFARVRIHWQGWDEDGEPDGVFVPVERGAAEAGWICYLTAEK